MTAFWHAPAEEKKHIGKAPLNTKKESTIKSKKCVVIVIIGAYFQKKKP